MGELPPLLTSISNAHIGGAYALAAGRAQSVRSGEVQSGAWGALVNILGRNVKLEYTAPNVAARRKAVLTLEWKVHRDESQHVHRPWLRPGKRVLPPRRIPTLGAC